LADIQVSAHHFPVCFDSHIPSLLLDSSLVRPSFSLPLKQALLSRFLEFACVIPYSWNALPTALPVRMPSQVQDGNVQTKQELLRRRRRWITLTTKQTKGSFKMTKSLMPQSSWRPGQLEEE
jgi:hypothetical protein